MSIPATEAVNPTPAGLTAGMPSQSAAAEDKQMFLELMVAQLRFQDPLNPTDSAEFLAQSAQFTALEKMQEVADQTAAMVSAQLAFGASGLVGREIRYFTDDGAEQVGTVTSVSFGADGPTLDVDGTTISLGQVVTVTAGSTADQAAGPSTDQSTAPVADDGTEGGSDSSTSNGSTASGIVPA